MALGGCADFCVGVGLDAFPASRWRDEPSPAMVRCQDAMVAGEVDSWFGYQGGQPGDEIHRFEGHLGRAMPKAFAALMGQAFSVRSFQRVDHLSCGAQ